MLHSISPKTPLSRSLVGLALVVAVTPAVGDEHAGGDGPMRAGCDALPDHGQLTAAVEAVVRAGGNTGLGNDMWATLVDRDGVVCAVTYTGDDRDAQWPGSRVISAQKANTAAAFTLSRGDGGMLPGLALSSANLWAATQPGGSLFGLQHSNPVDPDVAYGGNPKHYGQPNDPMAGKRIGGVNVFGGGLGLYAGSGERVGGLGLSGDTSCADHIKAWKVRDRLGLDFVPNGVSPSGDDNIIFDVTDDAHGNPESAGGFGHPTCLDAEAERAAVEVLPTDFPVGVE